MEDLEVEDIAEKAKKFRVPMFKPIGFFSKLFNVCYDNIAVDNLLNKAVILKELAEDKIKNLKHELFNSSNKIKELEESVIMSEDIIKKLSENLELQKDKHVKEIGKLSKTINDLTYCKSTLEEEIKGLRCDLNECNRKHEIKTNNNNKESTLFMDKLLKKNEKLSTELKDIKDFLKNKKITIEL